MIVLVLGLACVFIALFLGTIAVLESKDRARRRLALVQQASGVPREAAPSETSPLGERIKRRLGALADQVGGGSDLHERVGRKLEKAASSLRPGEFIAMVVCAASGGAIVGGILSGPFFAIALFGAGGFAPILWLTRKARRRTARVRSQLPDVLMLLSSSLRAGHSFLQALDAVAREVAEPTQQEFQRAVAEIRLGKPVDEALGDLAERIDSPDFSWAVLAVNIQREVGGNLAEVLDTVAATLRERDDIRRQVDVLSAEGRLSAVVLTALPFALGLYIAAVRPESIALLFTTRLGLVMVIGAGSLLLTGIVMIRKMVRIDV